MYVMRNMFFSLALLISTQALAHTKLTGSTPNDSDLLSAPPAFLELRFTGKVRLLKLRLVNAENQAIPLEFKPQKAAKDTFKITLPPLTPSKFIVHWQGMGSDAHKISGKLTFTLDAIQSVK